MTASTLRARGKRDPQHYVEGKTITHIRCQICGATTQPPAVPDVPGVVHRYPRRFLVLAQALSSTIPSAVLGCRWRSPW